MTGHCLNENFALSSFVFGTKEFDDVKTGENIRSFILNNILKDYLSTAEAEDFLMSSVIVTDNGANIVKALKSYKRLPCMCHNINLLVEGLIKDFPTNIRNTIAEVKALVTFFKHSGLNSRLTKTLKQDVSTRWNSLYLMIESFNDMFDELEHILYERKDLFRLQGIDMTIIKILLQFLNIFKEASERLSAAKSPTINEIYVWRKKIEAHCELTSLDSSVLKQLKHSVMTNLDMRMSIDNLHKIAVILDPNFKKMKFLPHSERNEIKHQILLMMMEAGKEIKSKQDHENKDQSSNSKKQFLSHDIFKDFMDDSDLSDEDDKSIECQLNSYINEKIKNLPVDICEYWNNQTSYPTLKKLAQQILSIPASSAASERIFSSAGKIFSENRTRLSPEHLDALIFLHKNKGLKK